MSNGKLSLNDNAEAAKAAAKKKPAPAPKRKPTTSRHESLSKCHTAPQKFGMSIGRAPKRAARPSQALDKLVGYCSPTLTQNGTSFKIQNLNLTQTLSQTMDRHWSYKMQATVVEGASSCLTSMLKLNHITVGASWIARDAKLRSRRGQQILWKTSKDTHGILRSLRWFGTVPSWVVKSRCDHWMRRMQMDDQ